MPDRHAPSEPPHVAPRRGFLAQLATAVAGLAAGALARPSTAVALADQPRPGVPRDTTVAPNTRWDLSWVDRITAAHRQLFDSPAIADGEALNKAALYLDGYHEVYGTRDADVNAVIVIRHKAIPMSVGNDVWARYDFIGDRTKLKGPTTGHTSRRNPFVGVNDNDKYGLVASNASLDALVARGVIVLACKLALGGLAYQIADKTKQRTDTVEAELQRSLVPGVILVPSGVFGVARAEEAGCHYIAPS